MERTSQGVKARVAGGFYVLAVVAAVLGEVVLHGRLEYAAGLAAVACYAVVTLLVYAIFKHVNENIALLAAMLNLAGLALEALRWNLGGIDLAMVFHGMFCVLVGMLIQRSRLMPRILGVLLVLAGFDWLLYLSPHFIRRVSPFNSVVGLLCEGLPFLWLLVMGVRDRRWNEFTSGARNGARAPSAPM